MHSVGYEDYGTGLHWSIWSRHDGDKNVEVKSVEVSHELVNCII